MTSPTSTFPRHVTLARARALARKHSDLNIFISLTDEDGDGPVVAVKDLIDVRNTVTTGGGRLLPEIPARQDAPVIEKIRRHGCVIVGKTNLHEWAFGATSTNVHYGVVHNPHDSARIAGGSSGGSAAAVAARMCDWAIGSDTGGSIRIPAALCGVVGVKPTYGLVNVDGTVPLSPSLDTLGPLAPDVVTAAWGLSMMLDSDVIPRSIPNSDQLRLAIPKGWAEDLDAETQRVWARVTSGLREIALPDRDRMQRACTNIMFAEAAAFHRHWMEQQPDQYGPETLSRLQNALKVSGADYVDAVTDRKGIRREMAAAMSEVDALLVPGTACVAPRIADTNVGEPLTRFTRPFNVSGQPVVLLPGPSSGLPVGIQVVGHVNEDARLLAVAAALERAWQD